MWGIVLKLKDRILSDAIPLKASFSTKEIWFSRNVMWFTLRQVIEDSSRNVADTISFQINNQSLSRNSTRKGSGVRNLWPEQFAIGCFFTNTDNSQVLAVVARNSLVEIPFQTLPTLLRTFHIVDGRKFWWFRTLAIRSNCVSLPRLAVMFSGFLAPFDWTRDIDQRWLMSRVLWFNYGSWFAR